MDTFVWNLILFAVGFVFGMFWRSKEKLRETARRARTQFVVREEPETSNRTHPTPKHEDF